MSLIYFLNSLWSKIDIYQYIAYLTKIISIGTMCSFLLKVISKLGARGKWGDVIILLTGYFSGNYVYFLSLFLVISLPH